MSAPLKDKDCIIAIFDSYAKTVMRNECRDAVDQEKRKRKKEQVGTEKMQYLFETQVHEDIYPSEHLVLQGKSYTCVITNGRLYNAMLRLPEKQRAVLIFGTGIRISRLLHGSMSRQGQSITGGRKHMPQYATITKGIDNERK